MASIFLGGFDMNESIIFNHLSEHFHQKIYATNKGRIRLAVIDADLDRYLVQNIPLKILDIGAGGGQMALLLAQKGHQLTLLEPAIEMQDKSKQLFEIERQSAHFVLGGLADLDQFQAEGFDVILCHAVLEWLDTPLDYFQKIKRLLKNNGLFSLAFYNKTGLVLHNLIRGNLNAAHLNARTHFITCSSDRDSAPSSKIQKGLTPINPLDPMIVESQLHLNHFDILQESGIRVFHDFMAKVTRDRLPFDQILQHELNYRHHPDFKRIARYVHWICQKKG